MNIPPNANTEHLRNIEFPAADQPLREDVNRLGALVGEILADQLGAPFLTAVEALRTAAIRRRENHSSAQELAALLRDVDPARAGSLVRAFATYFQAVNVAERVHRIRRRRDYERAGAAPQPGGLREAMATLVAAGVKDDELAALLARLHVEPVFTAHPTEAVRRSMLDKEQALVRGLLADLDRTQTPGEKRTDQERMRTALTAGWQTAEAAGERPRVADEMEHIGYFLVDILYAVLPTFFEVFEDALAQAGFGNLAVPDVLRFGTWVGGDMDGNPNVGAATIAATLATQRALVLAAYRRELRQLGRLLTQSVSEIGFAAAVPERVEEYRRRLPKAAAKLKARYNDMPYRQLLALIVARLDASARGHAGGYAEADEFRADIALIGASLREHHGEHAGWFAVRRLLRRIDAFGFHLATLDLRQESAAHGAALAALLADAQWPQHSAQERATQLSTMLDSGKIATTSDAAEAQAVLDVFRTAHAARRSHGARALGPYIVSMSHGAADLLAVLVLARIAGCVDDDGVVPLDVAPLFETIDDLHAAADILGTLFADCAYRAHLAARGDRQIVMLGYSDSAKDGGLFASRWALQRTQVALTELARDSGIRIVFFHGRGGSISRGGGKTERAVIAAPRGSVDGWLRLTEQGEVIHRKYGVRAIALRNLEQTTGAVLRASLRPRPDEPREIRWRGMVTAMAAESRSTYAALVHEDAQFPQYFRDATPIDVIERLRIGSRPPRRAGGQSAGIERLRAIPWVFAWSQNRAGLTAWYGVGSALSAGIERYGLESMREMARDWPFFGTLVEDVEMVLAKSDTAIFECYSRLADALHQRFFAVITAEFARTRSAVLAIRGADALLANDRRLRLSIRLRNPYVDPISLLQVDLLARWRKTGRTDDTLLHALVATINGIAAGLQNTG
ncbi:MAG: phosphoenolpyruvate carboxylase [Rudaea sp.]|nr:phosphoenolpyruvate carboxylase [Rudaea sp.]